MPEWTQEAYLKALRFAAEAHEGQAVPGTELPYLLHLSQVAMEVIAALRTEPTHDQDLAVQCALLHDTVEDTRTKVDQLQATFGPAVANGVSALTKDKALPKDRQMEDSLQRIRKQPTEIWMVKMADRITNLQPPPAHWSKEKARGYHDEAVRIRESLSAASPALRTRLLEKLDAYRILVG